jgi:hypothetical protein
MVRLVDEALRDPALLGLAQGLAAREVTLADPAVGTGAYLLGALRSIARTVEAGSRGTIAAAVEPFKTVRKSGCRLESLPVDVGYPSSRC